MIDYEEELINKDQRPPFIADVHLKSAIISDERDIFVQYLKNNESPCPFFIRRSIEESKDLLSILPKPTYINAESELIYHFLFNPAYLCDNIFPQMKVRFDNNKQITYSFLNIMVNCQMGNLLSKQEILNKVLTFNTDSVPDIVYKYFGLRELWNNLRDRMKYNQQIRSFKWHEYPANRFKNLIWYNSNFLFLLNGNNLFLFNYQQILMISDTINSRFLTYLYCSMSTNLGLTFVPNVNQIREIYDWGDRVLGNLGNGGYQVIKQFEPICTGVAIKKFDKLPICQQFLTDLIAANETLTHKNFILELVEILERESL